MYYRDASPASRVHVSYDCTPQLKYINVNDTVIIHICPQCPTEFCNYKVKNHCKRLTDDDGLLRSISQN